jgi:membrane protease YdiL (CAAX protease family)
MKVFVKSHPVISFIVLTFGFTWLFWGLVYGLRLSMGAGYLPFLIGAAGPSLMAFVVSAIRGGREEVRSLWKRVTLWRVGLGWYLAALLFPSVIALGGIGLSRMFGGATPDFSAFIRQWFLIPIALITGMLLGGPLEEEFGWRGFALLQLQKRYNALASSVIVGTFWGLWHLPAFLIPWSTQHNLPVILFLLHDIALAVVFTWIFNNTGGSVWMTMLAHAAFNLTLTILPVNPSMAGSEQPLVFAIGLLYLMAILVLVVFGPGTLTHGAEQRQNGNSL